MKVWFTAIYIVVSVCLILIGFFVATAFEFFMLVSTIGGPILIWMFYEDYIENRASNSSDNGLVFFAGALFFVWVPAATFAFVDSDWDKERRKENES